MQRHIFYKQMIYIETLQCGEIVLDKRTESITASQGNLIGTIDVTDNMIIEMDIAIGQLNTALGWQNVFHVGNSDNERLPGFWLGAQSGTEGAADDGFHLVYGTNAFWNQHEDQSAAGGAFTDNMNIHYKSYQTQDHLTIWENDEILYDSGYNSHPTPIDRNVYVGDPWYPAADVIITNLIIKKIGPCM